MSTELSEIGRALKRAQYRHHLALDRALAAVGTTIVQWDALRAISEDPASSAHDLALTTFQSDQAFGTLANRLVEKGLIVRTPGSGRRIEHRLTPAGEQALGAGLEVAEEILGESFAPLDDVERETLFELLSRVGPGRIEAVRVDSSRVEAGRVEAGRIEAGRIERDVSHVNVS